MPAGHVQITVYAKDGGRVATVFEREANARLIAAAPDMLRALEDASRWCENNNFGIVHSRQPFWLDAVNDAITKAEGNA